MSKPADFADTLAVALAQAPPPDPVQSHLAQARRLGHWGLAVALLGLAPVLGWLTLAPLSAAVVAQGFVKIDLNRRTLQHAEGGIVREVLVRDGEQVTAGQPLLVLGDVSVSANRQRLSYRLWAERAGVARLDAEQLRANSLNWSPALVNQAEQNADLADQLRKEQSLFATRREALNSQLALMQSQKARIAQETQNLASQVERVQESLDAQNKELAVARSLFKEGFVAGNKLTQLEASIADYKVKLEERRGEQLRAQQRVGELDLKMRSLQDDYRQAASDGIKVASVRLQELEQELSKADDASTRQVVAAPVAGVVMGLRFTSAAAVIAPREPIADIVPANPKLLVEARIRTDDVARVSVGQAASLRFTAFKYRSTKPVAARVTYVSPDRQVDPQTGVAYYLLHTEATEAGATGSDDGQKLQAGMPADVYIDGGARTPLEYLLEPVTQVLLRAGRER